MGNRTVRSISGQTARDGSRGAIHATSAEFVERRQEPRLDIARAVKVTVLGPEGLELYGELDNLSSRGAALLLERELPLDSAVRLETDDALLLGEVRWCRREGATVTIGLSVEHWLPDLKELARLRDEIFDP